MTITILSLNSIDIQRGLDDFSLDAGVTYLDNEPLTHVRTIPLYRERFFLFTPADGPLAGRKKVSWAEAASQPLCLLTPDMQNRRILDAQFSDAGAAPRASVETNSVLTLWAHVRSGAWSTVLPHPFLYMFGRAGGAEGHPARPGRARSHHRPGGAGPRPAHPLRPGAAAVWPRSWTWRG